MNIGMILYHADITNDNIVSVYQPKPPEGAERLHFCLY